MYITSSAVPTVIQTSAILNTAKLTKANSIKSTTYPAMALSIRFPSAPASIMASAIWSMRGFFLRRIIMNTAMATESSAENTARTIVPLPNIPKAAPVFST